MHDDKAKRAFTQRRIQHWDRISEKKYRPDRPARFYHTLLKQYYTFLIPPGLRVLELGCGRGDLLAQVRPSLGVGVDFSNRMLGKAVRKNPDHMYIQGDAHALPLNLKFDIIILSDLVNDVWDVQLVFKELKRLCHPRTRVIVNFFNEVWRPALSFARRRGWGVNVEEQSWLSLNDVLNLIGLAGFEPVNRFTRILLPLKLSWVAPFFNRFLVNIFPFNAVALTIFIVARPVLALEEDLPSTDKSVSVIVPARNEAGNIERIIKSVPHLGKWTEIIFVEGGSSDNTQETIEGLMAENKHRRIRSFQQKGRGKGDAVRLGFDKARGDVLMILDADLTVSPSDLPRFYEAVRNNRGEFINGVRLVYPMEDLSMRFFNKVGNKFFSLAFSWLLGQPIKDTLCGTKVLHKSDYEMIARNRSYFGDFDPFGDFDLLFGAAKINLKIAEMPIRYRARTYGETNISRWKHGFVLLRMVIFAAQRMRFI